MRRPALLALLLALTLLPATPAAALTFGLSDQQVDSWKDPRLTALGLRQARLIVPWDAATSEPARVQAWLDATAAAGMTPHVAFQHLRSERCPSSPCSAPSRSRYRAAVTAFRSRFPQVTTFTTWNEANHRSQPVASSPETVAGYHEELRSVCPSCTIVAGDVLDSGGYVRWLQRFLDASPTPPQLWGLHNYGDVSYDTTTGTDAVLATVPGELWIEETGGIVTLRSSQNGRETLRTDETRAAASVERAFAIARARPRITRMYLYHWRGRTGDPFDSGLIRPDGSARPSYAVALRNLTPTPTTTPTVTPTAAGPAVPRMTVTWSRARPAQLVVRLACRATTGVCRGSARIALRTRARAGARAVTRVLATRRYATTASRRTATLRITVPAARRRAARRAATRVVRATVTPTAPTGTRTVRERSLARPR